LFLSQWILEEVQYFAYFEPDSGGVPEVTTWCEREWNRVINIDPHHVGALTGSYNHCHHCHYHPPCGLQVAGEDEQD